MKKSKINDLAYIKKHYSESMMHLCRELFPSILQEEGKLVEILEKYFPHYKFLADDIVAQGKQNAFRSFVMRDFEVKQCKNNIITSQTPEELFSQAGYILYPECKTDKDIQAFKHYYLKEEALCTFKQKRLQSCRVWFAVKKNVDEIKREDFPFPDRQDEYGTSVISIQFSKANNHYLSIKNRYNHTVQNPDCTFGNNLDNIIEGLTSAFEQHYGLACSMHPADKFELENYVSFHGNFYHYNYKLENVYYCDNNIILDENKDLCITLPQHQILAGYHIFDVANNSVSLYDNTIDDSFKDSFGEILKIDKIGKIGHEKMITVKVKNGEDIQIKLNKRGDIIQLVNNNITSCGDYFLWKSKIKDISLNNLQYCGESFLSYNKLEQISLPNLISCEKAFLLNSPKLKEVSLPNLTRCGGLFISLNNSITKLSLPKLVSCKWKFLGKCEYLEELSLPNLETCGDEFLYRNNTLTSLSLPKLKTCGKNFMQMNTTLEHVSLPKLKECGDCFMILSPLSELYLPALKVCGGSFLECAQNLQRVSLPSLENCGHRFIYCNRTLNSLDFPALTSCGSAFLQWNEALDRLDLPALQYCGDYFLYNNKTIKEINMPELKKCGKSFMFHNSCLKEAILDNLISCEKDFLFNNIDLNSISLARLQNCGDHFLLKNKALENIYAPKLEFVGYDFLDSNPTARKNYYKNSSQPSDKSLGELLKQLKDKFLKTHDHENE